MVLNIDVTSTIADFAGIQPPKSWQGKSLLPLVNKEKKSIEKYKGEQSEYWKEVIGVEGDFKLEEEKQEV